jgi:hypothetical protein
MTRYKQYFGKLTYQPWMAPLTLAVVCFGAYGMLFPFLGWYWDEWPITWIANKLGTDGLARYFETNRPYWGLLYSLTIRILGAEPWRWQLFGLFWRWFGSVLVWAIARTVWPKREFRALTSGLFFAVWPSFTQQPIAMMYGHFFIVLDSFLASLWLNLKALDHPKRAVWLILAGLPLAAINLMAMEYFFLLELLRPLFLFAAFSTSLPKKDRILRTSIFWLANLLLLIEVTYWRVYIFPHQTHNYQPVILDVI